MVTHYVAQTTLSFILFDTGDLHIAKNSSQPWSDYPGIGINLYVGTYTTFKNGDTALESLALLTVTTEKWVTRHLGDYSREHRCVYNKSRIPWLSI